MKLLILYFVLAVIISFICSLLEAVLLSLSHAHIGLMVEQERPSGKILKSMKEKIDRPLSAILTINTVANTVGAAGVGAQALEVYGNKWVALISAILTFSILVFSEIIPKTLGAVYSKKLAPFAAYMIRFLIFITYPLVLVLEVLGRILAPGVPQVRVTREEMAMAADMGQAEGELQDREQRIINNLLRMNNISIREILTPRSVLFALPENQTVGETVKGYSSIRVSRIPVYGENLDDITGLVRRYQINQAFSRGQQEKTLRELAHPIHVVVEAKSVADVLDEFIQLREHLFLVVDEYGGTAGIVTLEDAIETLLGVEIVDELDSVVDMQAYALEQWEKRKRSQNL